jgi:folate-binding protein YgfZ
LNAHHCILERETLLHISGPDTLKFLQGQTTCDTDKIDGSHALLGAYCTPQGRMACDFLLVQVAQDHFVLRMRRDIVEQSAATFGKYIVFSKAELDSANSDWQCLACWGENARDVLGTVFSTLPNEQLGSSHGENFVVIQLDQAGQQFECYLNSVAQPNLLAQLIAALPLADESLWQALQINSGIGRIEAATVEQFIPQMLNFDITGHVNFNKGCYTGQEVVARMHYRGKPKRRMYLVSSPSGHTPIAGDALFTDGSEQSVGTVVNAARSHDDRVLALVVATVGGIENGLHVGTTEGPSLEVGELPYPLEKP